MKNNTYLKTLLLLSGVMANVDTPPRENTIKNTKPRLSEDNIRLKIAQNRNLREFVYGENKIFALNKKSADRKAKNNGWI